MAKKNVTVFKVESAGIDEFSKILLNPNFYSASNPQLRAYMIQKRK